MEHKKALIKAKGDRGWTTYARELGVSRQTIYEWQWKDHIPEKHRQKVIDSSDGRIVASDFKLPYS